MPGDELNQLMAAGHALRQQQMGAPVKINGVMINAVFSSPRLAATLGDSTVRDDKYFSTIRILKTAVPAIRTAAQWINDQVRIELPEGLNSWRQYHIVMEPTDVQMSGEWRIEIETI